jgi:hypothetical protein
MLDFDVIVVGAAAGCCASPTTGRKRGGEITDRGVIVMA